jgi:hypothetical protein
LFILIAFLSADFWSSHAAVNADVLSADPFGFIAG